jgi:hypothetical protein
MQIQIRQAITKDKQLVANIRIFEVQEITWIDRLALSTISSLPRELAL